VPPVGGRIQAVSTALLGVEVAKHHRPDFKR
jgi:hypothetical protein